MVENYEARLHIPPDPIDIRIVNSITFPFHNLEDCLSGLENGVHYSGVALNNFRDSNRFVRGVNVLALITSGVIGSNMLKSSADGIKGKLAKAGGVLILAHAAVQAKGALEKSRRQAILDSKDTIRKEDLRRAK